MEIIAGIHRADEASANMAHANVYIVVNGRELTVIDTGTPGNAQKIVSYIQKLGYQPGDVKIIILTHAHMDHIGSAKDLKGLTNAKVAAHAEDADYVSGKKPLPKPKNLLFRAASSFVKIAPVQVDIILKDGDKVAGLMVFHTPGHTPGSIMLLDEERKALFSGVTLRFDGEKVTCAPEQFSADLNQVRESIGKASLLDFEVMLPGHGEVLKPGASEEIKKFNETLRQK